MSETAPIAYRRACEDDLQAEHEVFGAAHDELHKRHAVAWTTPPFERWSASHRYLLRHDGSHSFVAEANGRIVGFSAALVREDLWFLSALHIHPEFQGRGIGRRLFDLSRDGTYGRQATISESIQLVSAGLYAQKGLIPVTPILHVGGEPAIDPPPDVEAAAFKSEAVAALDQAAYGCDRALDHGFWSERARCTHWARGGAPVAYSYVSTTGLVGPVAGRDPSAAAAALRAELARRRGQQTRVLIPGSARELTEVAVAAGLRFYTQPGLLQLSSGVRAPRNLAISGYALF
jgi:GNAT superfamily N-acetyltransferase